MGIIFDLDGTLLNTLYDLGNSCNRTLERYGYPTHAMEAYRYFVGNGMKMLVKRALPQDFSGDFELILNDFLNDYEANLTKDSRPYNGVIETLKLLNQKNIPIAVCTNKKQAYTDQIINHYFKDINFSAVIGDQFDGHHKPDPTHPFAIAKTLGLEPHNIYFVGDSNVDMQTAANAGMIPVGVSWGFRPVEELLEHGAKIVLNSMQEIVVAISQEK